MTRAADVPPLSGRAALDRIAPDLDRRPLLVVSDFDGTLSPIVLDPTAARILPSARAALRRLAGTPGVFVAVLSGRTAADVAQRVRAGGVHYLGNHGLERAYLPPRGRAERLTVDADPDPDRHAEAVDALADALPALVPDPWLYVERKGPTVAFHFRAAPDVDAAGRRVAAAVDSLDPEGRFVRYPGRRVLELRPPGAVAKGEAMRALLDELQPAAALMLGDDRSDAAAFAALREARDLSPGLRGWAVAVQARDEVPAEVATAADLVLASPAEAARLLVGVARRVSGPRRGPGGSAALGSALGSSGPRRGAAGRRCPAR
jgi:trehalose 6-phosphate phosphatase